jgi:hypothetical protein
VGEREGPARGRGCPGFLFFAGKKYVMLPSMTAPVALLIKSGILKEDRS